MSGIKLMFGKKTCFFAVLALFLFCGMAALGFEEVAYASEGQKFFDDAGLFTVEEEEELKSQIEQLEDETKMDVVLITTDDAEGKSAKKYAEDFYVNGNYGTGSDYSGVIFLIDMDNREIYLSPVGKMNRYLTDKRWNSILDDAYEYISEGDYMGCAQSYLDGVGEYYRQGIPSGQYNYNETTGKVSVYKSIKGYEAGLALLIALAVAVPACTGVKSSYSMKSQRRQSSNYLMAYKADCAFQFRESVDHLVDKRVTQMIVPRNHDNGDGSSGGGSSSRQSTTHSSSDRDFGGGGRKF